MFIGFFERNCFYCIINSPIKRSLKVPNFQSEAPFIHLPYRKIQNHNNCVVVVSITRQFTHSYMCKIDRSYSPFVWCICLSVYRPNLVFVQSICFRCGITLPYFVVFITKRPVSFLTVQDFELIQVVLMFLSYS